MGGQWSFIHWVIVGVIVLLLFGGKNKISDLMGDVAKGIKSFKKGMSEDDSARSAPTSPDPASPLEHKPAETAEKRPEVSKVG